MSDLLGEDTFTRLQDENAFNSSDSALIQKLAIDLKTNAASWNGLAFLNSNDVQKWERLLFRVIRLSPIGWEIEYSKFVEFVKVLSNNWTTTIPELLDQLDKFDIGVELFFKLEKNVTFKLAALLSDINVLQKGIYGDKSTDISSFISKLSHAFLPPTVYQLEEYGLPRMISKKIHSSGLFDFNDVDLTLHMALDNFKSIGVTSLLTNVSNLHPFDKYIIKYFYEGISLDKRNPL